MFHCFNVKANHDITKIQTILRESTTLGDKHCCTGHAVASGPFLGVAVNLRTETGRQLQFTQRTNIFAEEFPCLQNVVITAGCRIIRRGRSENILPCLVEIVHIQLHIVPAGTAVVAVERRTDTDIVVTILHTLGIQFEVEGVADFH